jgi:hypothetical protein
MGGRHLVLGRRFLVSARGRPRWMYGVVSLDLEKFIVGQHCLCEGDNTAMGLFFSGGKLL